MPNRVLTAQQKKVVGLLEAKGFRFLAATARDHWLVGEPYYIDTRVPVTAWMRREFNKANTHVYSQKS